MPQDYDSVITVSPAVLSGSLRNDVFTNVDISKRWRVHIKRGSAMRHFVLTNLLLLYEAGYLSPKATLLLAFPERLRATPSRRLSITCAWRSCTATKGKIRW